MRTKKLTTKQRDALDLLVYDLDELDNKPRRLFSALIEFVGAFLEEKTLDDKEHKIEVMDSIDEAERNYYSFLRIPEVMEDVGESVKVVKRKLTSRAEPENREDSYIIEKTCNEMAKEMLNRLVDHLD